METTEKIVETYCNYIKSWFTIPNIKCKGGKEIDLLALEIDPNNNVIKKRYHIEISIHKGPGFSKLTAQKYTEGEYRERTKTAIVRRSIWFFINKKFNDKNVKTKLAEYGFKGKNYKKVIVSLGWSNDVVPIAEKEDIELLDFGTVLEELVGRYKESSQHFNNDAIVTIQYLNKLNFLKESPKH